MRLLYYNPLFIPDSALPGMRRLARYGRYVSSGGGVMFFDRSGTIRAPIACASRYPVPAMRTFTKTLEDVCDARARGLLARRARLGARLYLLYSGGIDSTCMLVSFLKAASKGDRANITILLSEDSIRENPRFFEEHLLGKIACEPSLMFPFLLGSEALIVTAELNDLVFGSDYVRPFMKRYGLAKVLAPFDRAAVEHHFADRLAGSERPEEDAAFFAGQIERLRDKAPVPLVSHFDVFWWASFCTKWQFIATRILSLTTEGQRERITMEYARERVAHFYDTEDFQLWSMNNLDKRIKDDWKTYKWPSKEIIYAYTKDAEYRDNKTKKGSLGNLFLQRRPFPFIDEEYRLHRDLAPEDYYEPGNDFV